MRVGWVRLGGALYRGVTINVRRISRDTKSNWAYSSQIKCGLTLYNLNILFFKTSGGRTANKPML